MKNFTESQFVAEREIESAYIDGKPFRVKLWPSNATHPDRGRVWLAYRLYHGEEKIFEGSYFSPAPGMDRASDECFGALLSFLSLGPDDTDAEYVNDYTPEQVAWVKAHGEELGWIAMELEENA